MKPIRNLKQPLFRSKKSNPRNEVHGWWLESTGNMYMENIKASLGLLVIKTEVPVISKLAGVGLLERQ